MKITCRVTLPTPASGHSSLPRRIALLALSLLVCATTAHAALLTVTTTADSGPGSLRQAILDANAASGADNIAFAIPAASDGGCEAASGVCTITPTSSLPGITDALVIDGYTQPGASINTHSVESRLGLDSVLKVELSGTLIDAVLRIETPDVTVRGLVINHVQGFGIDVSLPAGGAVTIEGNYIGTDAGGTRAIRGSTTAAGIRAGRTGAITIGGTTPAARNLIAGVYGGVFTYEDLAPTIQGNLFGTDASGTLPLSNSAYAIYANPLTVAAVVGGQQPGAGNLIWADAGSAVTITGGVGNLVQGNLIGTDVSGSGTIAHTPSGNNFGVVLLNATDSLIGGTAATARNIISGFSGTGLEVSNIVGTVGPGNNRIEGNYIGTDIGGTLDRGNGGIGVWIAGSPGTVLGGYEPGAGNVIAFTKPVGTAQTGAGVLIGAGVGQSIIHNSIHSNASIGIDLAVNGGADGVTPNDPGDSDTGANNLQNYPLIASASVAVGSATVSGTINSSPGAALQLDFFANVACSPSGNGEGRTFIGSTDVTTDAGGDAAFGPLSLAVPDGEGVITATATNAGGDTSEFSPCPQPANGASTTALASSRNPSLVGESVTFTATVSGAAPGGSVQFADGPGVLGTAALEGGVATFATSVLALGTHPVSAVYSGDANNTPSTSPVLNQMVGSPAAAATSTTLVSSLNPSQVGQVVTFTASVQVATPPDFAVQGGAPSPSGSVRFSDGAGVLGTATLTAGLATLTTASLAAGTHPLTASYSGDADHAASVSALLTQRVTAVVVPPPPGDPTPAPTLSQWSAMLLVMLCLLVGATASRRALHGGRARR